MPAFQRAGDGWATAHFVIDRARRALTHLGFTVLAQSPKPFDSAVPRSNLMNKAVDEDPGRVTEAVALGFMLIHASSEYERLGETLASKLCLLAVESVRQKQARVRSPNRRHSSSLSQ